MKRFWRQKSTPPWAEDVQGIMEHRNGLAGLVRLQPGFAEVLDFGVVQLAYTVLPGESIHGA